MLKLKSNKHLYLKFKVKFKKGFCFIKLKGKPDIFLNKKSVDSIFCCLYVRIKQFRYTLLTDKKFIKVLRIFLLNIIYQSSE